MVSVTEPNQVIEPPARNPLYPLPADYLELSPAGQRQARLYAVHHQETPKNLVWAWWFFRMYYLKQAGFYKRWRESPPFHYQMVRDIGQYPYNAVAAPRAGAKSTILAVEMPMLLGLTRQQFSILLVLSKDQMVTKIVKTRIAFWLQHNKFIRDDFGKVKGQGPWSDHLLQFGRTGTMIEAIPVRGGMQGPRPDLILCDDPEVDPAMRQVSAELVENYERLLVNVVLPMLEEGESSIYWSGTLISKQCFLYYVVMTKDDERFRFWNRRLLDAEDDGEGNLLWEAKWDRAYLEREKIRLGLQAYNAQRRNRPGTAEDCVLPLTETTYYELKDEDQAWNVKPLESAAQLVSWTPGGEGRLRELIRPAREIVPRMFRVLTMDYAQCLSPASDYIAMVVIGAENSPEVRNTWWVLDLWMGRLRGSAWVPVFWRMALKWMVQYAAVEATAAQETLIHTAQEYVGSTAAAGWVPRVVPIKYPYALGKEERIGGLEWRFRTGKIKLRRDLRYQFPWSEMFKEVMGFTGSPGGTQYDDALDATAMAQFILKGPRGGGAAEEELYHEWDAKARLMAGDPTHEGVRLGLGVRPEDLTPEEATRLAMRLYNKEAEFVEERERERSLGLPYIGRARSFLPV